ncbi:MAG: hypothetical protein Q4D38_00275 [Planctomycetia bacterium]|nr:hypothetical protein [Planctomycetia bacterium]
MILLKKSLQEVVDIYTRLDEFRRLEPGWYAGTGDAFKDEDLDWLKPILITIACELPQPPVLYPYAEANVYAEWCIGDNRIIVGFMFENKTAAYSDFDLVIPGQHNEYDFDLKQPGELNKLIQTLKKVIV